MGSELLTFVSLFLSLTAGVHPVQVAVAPEIQRVELRLDGKILGELREPWILDCDFGDSIRPHRLEAVGFDLSGAERVHIQQLINVPRPRAESSFVLRTDAKGRPAAARLLFGSAMDRRPTQVDVRLDGHRVERSEESWIEIPPHARDSLHLLTAEIQFEGGSSTRTDLTFGGRHLGSVSTELTAVPLRSATTPSATLLGSDGQSLPIVATERGRGRVWGVVDRGASSRLARAGKASKETTTEQLRGAVLEPEIEDHQVRFVDPNAQCTPSAGVFSLSPPFVLERELFPWLLGARKPCSRGLIEQRLSDAVALAGLRAASSSAPRAVVLIVADDAVDDSAQTAADAAEYLNLLRVPLFVWTVGRDRDTPWGRADSIGSSSRLGRAIDDLLSDLDSQWIAWVTGSHLLEEIDLAESSDLVQLLP